MKLKDMSIGEILAKYDFSDAFVEGFKKWRKMYVGL